LTSNPTYWQKIQTLFDVLNHNDGITAEQRFDWVNNGLIVGASKEMRQSVGIAYQTTYTILVDVICGIQDEEAQSQALVSMFIPIFSDYLIPEKPNPKLDPYLEQIFTEVMMHLWKTNPRGFIAVWYAGAKECKLLVMHVRQDDGVEFDFQRWAHLALSLLHKLLEGKMTDDNTLNVENLDEMVKLFLKYTGLLVGLVWDHLMQSHPRGDWAQGMEFLATMVVDPLFCECLVNVDSMAHFLDLFKQFVPDPQLRPYLRFGPFLRIVVVFCRLFPEEGAEVWQTVLDNAIPKDHFSDLTKLFLVCKLVSVLRPSYTYLKAPPGVNETFAQGTANVLNLIEDPESDDAKAVTDLLVLIVSFRGNLLGGELTDL
jgi:hypothetical protein